MGPRRYRVVLEGELGPRSAAAFEGMTLTQDGGNTALTGLMRDQSHLQAVLARVSALGLTLLSAEAIDDGRAAGPGSPG